MWATECTRDLRIAQDTKLISQPCKSTFWLRAPREVNLKQGEQGEPCTRPYSTVCGERWLGHFFPPKMTKQTRTPAPPKGIQPCVSQHKDPFPMFPTPLLLWIHLVLAGRGDSFLGREHLTRVWHTKSPKRRNHRKVATIFGDPEPIRCSKTIVAKGQL